MANEEDIIRLSMLEEKAKQIEQQLNLVNQQIIELQNMVFNLDKIKDSKNKEILANIGRNIFAKAKLLDENLIIDVGSKVLVKKSATETKELVEQQIQEVDKIKQQLLETLTNINQELEKLMLQIQTQREKKEKDK